jgi:hypothetical protein
MLRRACRWQREKFCCRDSTSDSQQGALGGQDSPNSTRDSNAYFFFSAHNSVQVPRWSRKVQGTLDPTLVLISWLSAVWASKTEQLTRLESRDGPVAATTYSQIHVLEANFTSHASILKENLNICGGFT